MTHDDAPHDGTALTDLLTRAAATVVAVPGDELLDDDLRRGREARRRRTLGRLAGVGVVAVLGVGLSLALPRGTTAPAAAVPLVAFTGEDVTGFELEVVPEGWRVLTSHAGDLVLASHDDDGAQPGSFAGRIAIMLTEEQYLPGAPADAVRVTAGGRDVLVFTTPGTSPSQGVSVAQPDGSYLYVQVPAEVRWSDQQAADFAVTVGVTPEAVVGVG
ncbi:hypothetical protein [Cellulomonas sp. FA1]|uniref:hypothetical protein n=1 Tax=Cellulomonas sp. FA1 TaxID=1346710 RepID=UPI0006268B0C|nr:hypothetical protein [Cellulomonas sp. FA1]